MPASDPLLDHRDHVPDPLGLAGSPPSATERALDVLAGWGLTARGAGGLVGLVLLGALAWWWLRAPTTTAADAMVPLTPSATTVATGTSPSTVVGLGGAEVAAHAAGAVRRPGLYRLPAGSRVDDLLRAAGGALSRADLDRVNLAAPVTDGSQVYVPRRGEGAGGPGGAADPAAPAGTEPAPEAPVNVNTADLATLDTLPGVGPATAAAIIEHREANGAFVTVDQLIDVRGIGEAKLAAMAELVTV